MSKKNPPRPSRDSEEPDQSDAAESMGDQIYSRLKNDIVTCAFQPGDEITEIGIAEAYEVGRAPVRAALSRLCQDRLLVAVRRRGHVVAPITNKTIQDVFQLRLIVEPAAARAAVGRVDVKKLRAFVANPGHPTKGARGAVFLDENRRFHMTIARASGNERVERVVSELYDELSRLLHLGLYAERDSAAMRADHARQEAQHKAIIDAFAREDGAAVEAAVRAHIDFNQAMVTKAILSGRVSFSL